MADDFIEQLDELRGFGEGTMPANHPFAAIRAMPDDVSLPPIWLLGSSSYSARLAAELGLGFAFAGHFSPDRPEEPMRIYREGFRPGPLERPHAILALAVFCADTEEAATRMASSILLSFAQLRVGRPGRLASPEEALAHVFTRDEEAAIATYRKNQIVGTPAHVCSRIEAAASSTRADEIMVVTHAYESAARLRSYELVASSLLGGVR